MRICFPIALLLPVIAFSQTTREDFKSVKTGDIYQLIIKRPGSFDSTKTYHHVYFTDAGINSGYFILNQPEDSTKNCILIGIAHKGDWDTKRQRDFIPSDAGGYSNKNFGQASKFFSLMKEELVPYINKKFGRCRSKIFIGHSFGGLIALYVSIRDNKLFDRYYAVSPSVWANYYELMAIEKNYAAKNKNYTASVFMYAGSLEFLNKVLSSSKEFYETVKERKYNGLMISHEVIRGANHYGIVPNVIPKIFRQIRSL